MKLKNDSIHNYKMNDIWQRNLKCTHYKQFGDYNKEKAGERLIDGILSSVPRKTSNKLPIQGMRCIVLAKLGELVQYNLLYSSLIGWFHIFFLVLLPCT